MIFNVLDSSVIAILLNNLPFFVSKQHVIVLNIPFLCVNVGTTAAQNMIIFGKCLSYVKALKVI